MFARGDGPGRGPQGHTDRRRPVAVRAVTVVVVAAASALLGPTAGIAALGPPPARAAPGGDVGGPAARDPGAGLGAAAAADRTEVAEIVRPAPGAGYAWPLSPPPIVSAPFRAPTHAYGPGHRGVDLVGAVGQPVLAARGGVVVHSGPVGGRGVVSVAHDDGLRTTYEPLQPVVRAGARVPLGAVLGFLLAGHGGCRPACLHWGVRRSHTDYLDPLVLLQPLRVRLLPVPDPGPGALSPRRAPPADRAAGRRDGSAVDTPATR
jgi:murein DD-endopeptidase MepM/ murein hydrolase activator NlpD